MTFRGKGMVEKWGEGKGIRPPMAAGGFQSDWDYTSTRDREKAAMRARYSQLSVIPETRRISKTKLSLGRGVNTGEKKGLCYEVMGM